MRDSTRYAGPWPTRRRPQVRLSRPQATAVGAHESGWNRLYEFTVGANRRASSREAWTRPPSHQRNVSLMLWGFLASHICDFLPLRSQRLEWMWQDEPTSSMSYL